MSEITEISGVVISMSDLVRKLTSILADSVILDLNLGIAALGRDIEVLMGVTSKEVIGEQFADVCIDSDIRKHLQASLKAGFFVDLKTHLWTRGGDLCKVSLSGFYLGLISDINGYIVLKVKPEGDGSGLRNELYKKKRELDSFIYRAAYDLRGPLATIKGLVSLLKIRKSDVEMDQIAGLLESHTEKLDDRLFKLVYMANDNGQYKGGKGCIDFRLLKDSLVKTLKDNRQLKRTTIAFETPEKEVCHVNDVAIARMVRHTFLHIVGIPLATASETDEARVDMEFEVENETLNICIDATGFITSDQIRNAILQPTSLYNDLLAHPLLLNYYVAHREAVSLGASFRVNFHGAGHQVINVAVPVPPKAIYQNN